MKRIIGICLTIIGGLPFALALLFLIAHSIWTVVRGAMAGEFVSIYFAVGIPCMFLLWIGLLLWGAAKKN